MTTRLRGWNEKGRPIVRLTSEIEVADESSMVVLETSGQDSQGNLRTDGSSPRVRLSGPNANESEAKQ